MLLSLLVAGAVGVTCEYGSFRTSLTLPDLRAQMKMVEARSLAARDIDPSLLYPAHNLSVPIDHFHNESQ